MAEVGDQQMMRFVQWGLQPDMMGPPPGQVCESLKECRKQEFVAGLVSEITILSHIVRAVSVMECIDDLFCFLRGF